MIVRLSSLKPLTGGRRIEPPTSILLRGIRSIAQLSKRDTYRLSSCEPPTNAIQQKARRKTRFSRLVSP